MAVKIKICGITTAKEAGMLNAYLPDYAGFVMFYEKSRRNNSVEQAWKVMRYLDRRIQKVAVTVSPTPEQVRMLEQMDFQVIQIHGEVSKEAVKSCRIPIWRAHNLSKDAKLKDWDWEDRVTGYVLDGAVPGSGKTFDWEAWKSFDRKDKMMILAGGLNADNVEAAIEALSPDVVDVSSGVEGEQGKDARKIKEFIGKVKAYE